MLALPGMVGEEFWAWENRTFDPDTVKGEWIKENLMIIDERQAASDLLELRAYMQFTLMSPSNSGTEKIDILSQQIVAALRPKKSFGTDDSRIYIDKGLVGSGRNDSKWHQLPVLSYFRAYTHISQ